MATRYTVTTEDINSDEEPECSMQVPDGTPSGEDKETTEMWRILPGPVQLGIKPGPQYGVLIYKTPEPTPICMIARLTSCYTSESTSEDEGGAEANTMGIISLNGIKLDSSAIGICKFFGDGSPTPEMKIWKPHRLILLGPDEDEDCIVERILPPPLRNPVEPDVPNKKLRLDPDKQNIPSGSGTIDLVSTSSGSEGDFCEAAKNIMEESQINASRATFEENRRLRQLHMTEDAKGVKERWIEQLCRFRDVTSEIALGISEKYESPKSLYDTYKKCGSVEEGSSVLMNIEYTTTAGKYNKRVKRLVGKQISTDIYSCFTPEGGWNSDEVGSRTSNGKKEKSSKNSITCPCDNCTRNSRTCK